MSRTKGAKGKAEPKQVKRVMIRLDEETYQNAKDLAEARNKTINKYLKEIVENIINLSSKYK